MTGQALLGERPGACGEHLAQLHFTMQQEVAAAPSRVKVASLDPLLRSLLFTDGTVTRALEAQTLAPVAVEVLEQSEVKLPRQAAGYLEAETGEGCLLRRVSMSIAGAPPAVWAESHILPARLPDGFVDLMGSTSHGIGGSIERSCLESRRELLWFRLGTRPGWADAAAPPGSALVRLYRVFTNDRPALLICEAFAIERRLGMYRPLRSDESVNGPVLTAP